MLIAVTQNQNDNYRFDLTFDGELVENSADAFDVANTIMAVSSLIQEVVSLEHGEETAKKVSLNINAFKEGSLKTQFLFLYSDPTTLQAQALVIAGTTWGAIKYGRQALGVVKDVVNARKWLKGRKPDKIEAKPGGDTYVIHANNSKLTINKTVFKALQDKAVAKNLDKAIEPLEKEGSQLESLSITGEDEKKPLIQISKAEAKYVKRGDEELQTIDKMRLKGVVTKIDTKVRSGYINLGNMGARRVSFSYSKGFDSKQFDILVQSLRSRVQIYVKGAVDSDMEGHPKSIDIIEADEDEKLL